MGRIKVVVITGGMPKFEVKNVDFQGGGQCKKIENSRVVMIKSTRNPTSKNLISSTLEVQFFSQ